MIGGLFVEKLFLVKPFVKIHRQVVRLRPSGPLIYEPRPIARGYMCPFTVNRYRK